MNAEEIAKAYIARCDQLEINSSYSRVSRALLVACEALEKCSGRASWINGEEVAGHPMNVARDALAKIRSAGEDGT